MNLTKIKNGIYKIGRGIRKLLIGLAVLGLVLSIVGIILMYIYVKGVKDGAEGKRVELMDFFYHRKKNRASL